MFQRIIGRSLLVASLWLAVGTMASPAPTGLDAAPIPPISDAANGLQRAARLDPPTARPVAPGVETSVSALNRVRAEAGVAPVRLDPAMSDIALAWSTEMSRTGFRHSGGPYGENIAWTSDDRLHPDDAALTFHDMWVRSPGHFANMTDPSYTAVGVGLFLTSSGWWATHVFR